MNRFCCEVSKGKLVLLESGDGKVKFTVTRPVSQEKLTDEKINSRADDPSGFQESVKANYFFRTALLTARTAPNRTAAQGQMIQVRCQSMV